MSRVKREDLYYDQVRRDFEFLETLDELHDQVELDAQRLNLMRDPTKARAASMYLSAISLWIAEHGDDYVAADKIVKHYREEG